MGVVCFFQDDGMRISKYNRKCVNFFVKSTLYRYINIYSVQVYLKLQVHNDVTCIISDFFLL